MNIALAQIRIEAADRTGNVGRALTAIEEAAARGADLIVLPEVFSIGYFAFSAYARYAEGLNGETLTRIREAAVDHDTAILAGTIIEDLADTAAETDHPVPQSEGLANTAVLYDASGNRTAVYRKHHLFGYASAEADLLVPGERLETAELGGFTVGISTCYDLRFPELYRKLTLTGATLLVVPSAWPYPRVEHWEILPRARAIENLCYLATANGTGTFDDATLLGRSTVYDPWGSILASTHDEPSLVTADLEPDRVTTVREEFPAWRDRRLEAETLSGWPPN